MDWKPWRLHFERNALRPLPGSDPWDDVPAGAEGGAPGATVTRAALARSLAIFQLGEAGEGRIARQIWKTRIPGIDDDYRVALGLFVKEEGRHARILAGLVKELGGELLGKTWTEGLFVSARRLLGVRLKLLVLLAAEIVGAGFYGLLADRVPAVREALREMCVDEERHLAFHADFFRTQTTTAPRRFVFRVVWAVGATAAALVVLADHRRTLRALGIPMAEASRRLFALLEEARERSTARSLPRCVRGPAPAAAHAPTVATP